MHLIEAHRDKVINLCEKHKVDKLFAFGSILTDRFNNNSDVDLLVNFKKINLYEYADNYFLLKFSLEDLFNRKVDLLEDQAVKNPFFRKSVDAQKKLIYG